MYLVHPRYPALQSSSLLGEPKVEATGEQKCSPVVTTLDAERDAKICGARCASQIFAVIASPLRDLYLWLFESLHSIWNEDTTDVCQDCWFHPALG